MTNILMHLKFIVLHNYVFKISDYKDDTIINAAGIGRLWFGRTANDGSKLRRKTSYGTLVRVEVEGYCSRVRTIPCTKQLLRSSSKANLFFKKKTRNG